MDQDNNIDGFSRRRPQHDPEEIIEISSDEDCVETHSFKAVTIKQEKFVRNGKFRYCNVSNNEVRTALLPPEPDNVPKTSPRKIITNINPDSLNQKDDHKGDEHVDDEHEDDEHVAPINPTSSIQFGTDYIADPRTSTPEHIWMPQTFYNSLDAMCKIRDSPSDQHLFLSHLKRFSVYEIALVLHQYHHNIS